VFEDAVRDGHFETIEIIFKGREWLWAERKFSAMASLVENYDPSNREHRGQSWICSLVLQANVGWFAWCGAAA
jgi:hypothetical protein